MAHRLVRRIVGHSVLGHRQSVARLPTTVDRPGDNLYTNCVLALNARTGELKWHYQFTPHDVKDRDATEPNVLVDTRLQGQAIQAPAARRSQRLLLRARPDERQGAAGQAVPAPRGLGVRHRRRRAAGRDDPHGCPSDAANWSSTAYSPETGCTTSWRWKSASAKPGGYPDQPGQRFLRAVNIDTGEIVWEVPQPGPARAKTWSGVLATAGGLIFYGQPNGGFAAVDQRNGKTLWQFPTNVRMKASPMTFAVAWQAVRRGRGRTEHPLLRSLNLPREPSASASMTP